MWPRLSWVQVPSLTPSIKRKDHCKPFGLQMVCNGLTPCAPVAQLDRAPDFESVGRRFESCRAYQSKKVIQAVLYFICRYYLKYFEARQKSQKHHIRYTNNIQILVNGTSLYDKQQICRYPLSHHYFTFSLQFYFYFQPIPSL